MEQPYREYDVPRAEYEPVVRFMIDALEQTGCRIIRRPSPDLAPFRFTFEPPQGERLGVVAYAFPARNGRIKSRPADENRFEISYGRDLGGLHDLWQDPDRLYVTLLIGVDPNRGFFVAPDPMVHSPTRFPVSVEYPCTQVEEILRKRWFAWEREPRVDEPHSTKKSAECPIDDLGEPLFEVLVGGTAEYFLRLIRFEFEVLGEAAGERHFVADNILQSGFTTASPELMTPPYCSGARRSHTRSKAVRS